MERHPACDNFRARGYLYSNEKLTDLGTLGRDYSNATFMNGSGQVIGTSTTSVPTSSADSEGNAHALILEQGMSVTGLNASLESGDPISITIVHLLMRGQSSNALTEEEGGYYCVGYPLASGTRTP